MPTFGLSLVVLALCVAGCRPAGDTLRSYRLLAMATWVDLSLPADAERREPALIASIERELRSFERDYYAWGDGELAALNRALTGSGRFEASDALAGLLETAQTIAATTGGAFDPGVGPLVELWGFHREERRGAAPGAGEIAALLAATGSIADLTIDAGRIAVAPPPNAGAAGRALHFTLDLGGIAKGAAVDRIVGLLETAGIEPALVNAGGDLRVLGARADRRWRVGIAAPRGDGVLGVIELEPGEAAFTSGDYERYFEQDGERLHHILDPRTGHPVTHTQALTVIAREGTLADAAATALFVAGPDAWRPMARALGIEAVLRVDASGAVEMTSAMRDRFRPGAGEGSAIIAAAD
jgi:thiamine biosynthesis lipoprotein